MKKDGNIGYEIHRQKAIETELGCEFIRINPAKEIFVEIGKIQNYIVKSTKKLTEESTKEGLIDQLSNKLLKLEFKSNNSIKTRCLKYVLNVVKARFCEVTVLNYFFACNCFFGFFRTCVAVLICSLH